MPRRHAAVQAQPNVPPRPHGRTARARALHHEGVRRGVTLFELLVVLVLIAISAALVWPAISATAPGLLESEMVNSGQGSAPQAGASTMIADAAVDPVLTSARRTAIKRGEPVRLRVGHDGVWAVVSARDGAAIESGRITAQLNWWPDVVVDALGTCVLAVNATRPNGGRSWDALSCRWRGAP